MTTRTETRRSSAGTGSAARIGRSEWIKAAVDALQRDGIEGVRVEVLATRLGVTKGSFYWHFADRAALHDAMLAHWRAVATAAIIDRVEREGGAPRAKLRYLTAITARGASAPRLETAMRGWARQDKRVAQAIATADRERIAYVTGLLQAIGFEPEAAELRARLLFLAVIGSYFSTAHRVSAARDFWREVEALIV
jgi:AcrR family transcriptional regulator